ncbi:MULTISPECIES: FAD:protein FMN transferase [unclassified Ruegeria]|uniref:FAD:protein FMN transferase n=1 Tax=unclassified Ruegeria TaxID=2625375 RepID=UPI001ADA2977|nr:MULTISPECIES: FAD:protein FMN transferase [unclassified Ruegeria]MBO9411706.1 FAD:protein FMN transferase [Ruegeria sp. R8_1]MBO9415732.1 FAD:protein FMN transferase [Ruegeria sp. R8_2]
MIALTRRRFLTISAACACTPVAAASSAMWHGTAMGAKANLRLEGLNAAEAAPIFAAITAELDRLENIFSLYRPYSELSRLNTNGHLTAPSPELLQVLSLCSALHDASDGAFDPTIQPLWMASATRADARELDRARQTVGLHKISVDTDAIRLPHAGLAGLTLNGIAQGEITDRITTLLNQFGLRNVLVNMGEISARGTRNDGRAWQVGLAGPKENVHGKLELRDRAVATSVPGMMRLAGGMHHIFDPNNRLVPQGAVSVSAPNAALADGLSTALCLTPTNQIGSVLLRFPDAKLESLIQ